MTQSRSRSVMGLSRQTVGASLALTVAAVLLNVTLAEARAVTIEPNPNKEVGIMSSESKYFNCKSDSRQDTLVWIGPNGQPINNDPNNRIYVVNKKNWSKLELKSPTKGDSGQYKCVARNRQSNQELAASQFHLHVFNPTAISGTAHYTQKEGRTQTLECIITSDRDTQLEFSWMFGNVDLSAADPAKYRIDTSSPARVTSGDEVRTVSRLTIPSVSKDNDGQYTCAVDTTNRYLSDEKELKVTLRVQYKPRFQANTPKEIWVGEEAVHSGGPILVNISCIVVADPVAALTWFQGGANQGLHPSKVLKNGILPSSMGSVKAKIENKPNYSQLTLQFNSIEDIKQHHRSRENLKTKYTCRAENDQGQSVNVFEIKVGRLPDSPQIVSIDYKDGSIVLQLNESQVEPKIDVYRLEVGPDQAHLFNKTANAKENSNNTYVIELNLPRGEHKVNIVAHNPVGWSENPSSSYFLSVVSSSSALNISWMVTLTLLAAGQYITEGSISRFFFASMLRF